MSKVVHRTDKYQVWNDADFTVERIEKVNQFGSKAEAVAFIDSLTLTAQAPPVTSSPSLEEVVGWHFIDRGGTLNHGDGRKVVAGTTVHVDGPIVPMQKGLLISSRATVALKYGRRPIVCRVKGGGEIVPHGEDQFAVSDRTCIWLADATNTLINWGGWCALRAITHRQEKDLSVDQRTIDAAKFALEFNGSGDPTPIYSASSAASFASMTDMEATLVANAATYAINAVNILQSQSKMQTSFPGFKPPQQGSVGISADFTVVSVTNAADTAARASSDFNTECGIQNAELERRLFLLEPK